jgi:hypothetical protein
VSRLNIPEKNRRGRNDKPTETDQQYSNDEDGSFGWVAQHNDALYKQYGDHWILVDNSSVAASAPNPEELVQLAQRRGISVPFITKAGPPERPSKAIYGGQII